MTSWVFNVFLMILFFPFLVGVFFSFLHNSWQPDWTLVNPKLGTTMTTPSFYSCVFTEGRKCSVQDRNVEENGWDETKLQISTHFLPHVIPWCPGHKSWTQHFPCLLRLSLFTETSFVNRLVRLGMIQTQVNRMLYFFSESQVGDNYICPSVHDQQECWARSSFQERKFCPGLEGRHME